MSVGFSIQDLIQFQEEDTLLGNILLARAAPSKWKAAAITMDLSDEARRMQGGWGVHREMAVGLLFASAAIILSWFFAERG